MGLSNLVSQLSSAPEFQQVVIAGSAANTPSIDTEALLTNVLVSTLHSVYCLNLPENAALPNLVYMLAGGKNLYFEKHLLAQVDTFVVSLRHNSLSALAQSANQLLTALINSSYAIEIIDKQKDYEPERQCYRLDLELSFTVPATGSSAQTPAAILYSIGDEAEQSDYDNFIKQKVTTGYGIAILTTGNNLEQLRQVVRDKLLGFQQTPQHYELQFARGTPLEHEGGLSIWRDIYQDSNHIQQN